MKIRGNNFLLDLGEFEKLSREVGFYNSVSGFKYDDERYDDDAIKKYEGLREQQLIMFDALIDAYGSASQFTKQDVNWAYLCGVLNVGGIDGLHKELQRLKAMNVEPHNIIESFKKIK